MKINLVTNTLLVSIKDSNDHLIVPLYNMRTGTVNSQWIKTFLNSQYGSCSMDHSVLSKFDRLQHKHILSIALHLVTTMSRNFQVAQILTRVRFKNWKRKGLWYCIGTDGISSNRIYIKYPLKGQSRFETSSENHTP